MNRFIHSASLLVALLLVFQPALSQTKNGFELGNALIPVAEILRGGPPRDGIPSINDPVFQNPADTGIWRSDDLMLTYDQGPNSFAYPIGILNWHEIVNHDLGATSLLVTFCPLCGTGMAFNPVVCVNR